MFTVVGAGYAGRMALTRLRVRCPHVPLTLIEPRTHGEERVRLHLAAAGVEVPRVELGAFTEALGATHLRAKVTGRSGRVLSLSDGSQHTCDGLILAMGRRERPAPGPAHHFADHDAALRLHRALELQPRAHLTVVGAGFSALETAGWLGHRFPMATIAIWRAQPRWSLLSDRACAMVDRHLQRRGIEVVDGARITDLHSDGAASAHHARAHDLVVWLAGSEPHEPGAGHDGRLGVDANLQLEPGVFAAGDLACPPIAHRLGCVSAIPMGAHAADNLARSTRGEDLQPFRFREVMTVLSLDPTTAIVQGMGADGRPTFAFEGRLAALTKRALLGYIRRVVPFEARLRHALYRWPTPQLEAA